jgi:hypothetical protein
MLNKILKEIDGDTKVLETLQYKLLEAIYKSENEAHSVSYPVRGDVAREEHVTSAFREIERLSALTQEEMERVSLMVQDMSDNLESANQNLVQQLLYLKNEANFWKIQYEVEAEDLSIFYSEFGSGFALPVEDLQERTDGLTSMQFRTDTPAGEKLESPFYTFGEPFNGNQVSDPIAHVKEDIPVKLQGILLHGTKRHRFGRKDPSDDNVTSYLTSLNPDFQPLHPMIRWNQDIDYSREVNINMNGPIILKFNSPTEISYLELDIVPCIVHDITLYPAHEPPVQYPAADIVYFPPTVVNEIHINLKESDVYSAIGGDNNMDNTKAVVQAIKYNLAMYTVVTIQGNDSQPYVYYVDEDAQKIRENL